MELIVRQLTHNVPPKGRTLRLQGTIVSWGREHILKGCLQPLKLLFSAILILCWMSGDKKHQSQPLEDVVTHYEGCGFPL